MNSKQYTLAALGILLAGIAIAYYLLILVPNQRERSNAQVRREQLFSLKQKCAEQGKKFFDELNDANDGSISLLLNPEYTYNESLNACLYAGGWINHKQNVMSKEIINLTTNNTIASYYNIPMNDQSEYQEQVATFNEQRRKLFEE